MHRRRSLSVLLATSLALALGTTFAAGTTLAGQKGKVGTFVIVDPAFEPGVA